MKNPNKAFHKSLESFTQFIPLIFGVLLLASLASSYLKSEDLSRFFTGNPFSDSLAGAVLGSLFAGNPVTSYILGGELTSIGVSLVAVTAFIVAWVTVGLLQAPLEASALGVRFAIIRNAAGFVSAFLISVLTVATVDML